MARVALLLFSSPAFAHPGHGALEIHWHGEDIALAVLGFLAFFLIVYFIRKALKK